MGTVGAGPGDANGSTSKREIPGIARSPGSSHHDSGFMAWHVISHSGNGKRFTGIFAMRLLYIQSTLDREYLDILCKSVPSRQSIHSAGIYVSMKKSSSMTGAHLRSRSHCVAHQPIMYTCRSNRANAIVVQRRSFMAMFSQLPGTTNGC